MAGVFDIDLETEDVSDTEVCISQLVITLLLNTYNSNTQDWENCVFASSQFIADLDMFWSHNTRSVLAYVDLSHTFLYTLQTL